MDIIVDHPQSQACGLNWHPLTANWTFRESDNLAYRDLKTNQINLLSTFIFNFIKGKIQLFAFSLKVKALH